MNLLMNTYFLVLLVLLDFTVVGIVFVLGIKFVLKKRPNFFYETERRTRR